MFPWRHVSHHRRAFVPLNSMWGLLAKAGQLDLKCTQLEGLLGTAVLECRRIAFQSLSVGL